MSSAKSFNVINVFMRLQFGCLAVVDDIQCTVVQFVTR